MGALSAAGVPGTIMAWDDVLHDGPVPGGLAAPKLARVRARFLAGDEAPAPIEARLLERDERLAGASGRVVLWFEHDLYDQLQLIQVLDRLTGRPHVEIVPQDTHIATDSREGLAGKFGTARKVTTEAVKTAAEVWSTFTAETPEALAANFRANSPPLLPHLRGALRRWLEMFPDGNGVGRTERLVLELLGTGPTSGLELFRRTQAAEEARFRGDWSFWGVLDGLRSGLIQADKGPHHKAVWAITPLGRAVLAGQADRIAEVGIERWHGGTRLTTESHWRWTNSQLYYGSL